LVYSELLHFYTLDIILLLNTKKNISLLLKHLEQSRKPETISKY